jgi:hypothetical protein
MNDSNNEPSYKWQAANDIAEIERVFPSNSQKAQQTNTEIKSFADAVRNGRISQITADEWLKAIQFFFSKAGVLRAEKTEGPLSGSTRTGLSYWAEKKSVLLKGCQSYLCADLGRPPAKNQKNCVFLNYPTHKYESIEGAKLFQHGDDDPDTFLSGFWFHDIVKDALLLKSVVNLQIEYWKPEFYSPSIDRLKKLLYTNQQEVDVEEKHKDGILCLVSWLNSWKSATFKSSIEGGNVQVTSVLDKKTFSLEIKQLYTEPVLTAPTDIDPTRIEDAKILLLWLLYNQRVREKKAANAEKKEQAKKAGKNKKKDYSNYVRGRMKAIWNLYMRDKWQLRKGLDYPIKTTDITGYTGDKGKV